MNNFLTHETPGKVLALLGSALFSLAFMFAVTSTNASFSGTQLPVNDLFSPSNVVTALDYTSNSYSNFLAINLFEPAQASYNLAAENVSYVASNFSFEVAMLTGMPATNDQAPQVAGAFTTAIHGQ